MQISLAEVSVFPLRHLILFNKLSILHERAEPKEEEKRGPLTFRTHNPNNTLSLGVCVEAMGGDGGGGKSSCQSIQLDHAEHIITQYIIIFPPL